MASTAKKAWAWLGQRSKTTPVDVAPASYELETTAVTSENYLVVLRAIYTVGPKIKPLLRPPDLIIGNKGPRHVKKLLERHVSAVAAGMTTEQMFMKGSLGFVKEVLCRVNLDLAESKSGGADGLIFVHPSRVESLAVHVPADKVSVLVAAEEGGTAWTTAFFALQLGATKVQVVKLNDGSVHAGQEVAVAMAVVDPATEKVQWEKQIKVAELHMELEGKITLRLKLKKSEMELVLEEQLKAEYAQLKEAEAIMAEAKRALEQVLARARKEVTTVEKRVDRMRMNKNRSEDATKRLKSITKSLNSLKVRIYDCEAELLHSEEGNYRSRVQSSGRKLQMC